jgi:predicted phosphodiesterase
MAYPEACFEGEDEDHHFFILGDWGGMCGFGDGNDCNGPDRLLPPQQGGESWSPMPEGATIGEPWPMKNNRANSNFVDGIDDSAQQKVRDAMVEVAKTSKPEFVISVGDNFYPGGVIEHCNGVSAGYDFDTVPHQFNTTFEVIYDSPELAGKEWMSVLGNHDYGGTCMQMGWPQQIWYTWNTQRHRWVMPAQYYSRKMWFGDVSVDIFFLDGNIGDGGINDPNHDLCNPGGNLGGQQIDYCAGFLADDYTASCPGTEFKGNSTAGRPYQAMEDCADVFKALWAEQLVWLDTELPKSTADWQFLVTHYPPYHDHVRNDIKPLTQKHGVDLLMTGHSHNQVVCYKEECYAADYGDTAWVVSGGGGGITSEGVPQLSPLAGAGDHQYGFMDVTMRKDTFTITAYAHLQTKGQMPTVMSTTEVSKNEPTAVKFASSEEPVIV